MEHTSLTALFFVVIAVAVLLLHRINRLSDEIREMKNQNINEYFEGKFTIPEESILQIVALVVQTLLGEKIKKQAPQQEGEAGPQKKHPDDLNA